MAGPAVERIKMKADIWYLMKGDDAGAEPLYTVTADLEWKRGGGVTLEYPHDANKEDLESIFQSVLQALRETVEPNVVIRIESQELEVEE